MKIIFSKQVFCTVLLIICTQQIIFSQQTLNRKSKQSGSFIGLSFGPSQTNIINEGVLSVAGLQNKKMYSLFGSLEFGYYFSDHIGLSTGVSYSSYKTQLSLDVYENVFNAIDRENEAYESRVSGVDIKESQDIGLLSIPLYLNFRLPISKTFGFTVQTGINLSVPINTKYSSSGTFTYKGYFPKYNVLLENLPDYGYPSNQYTVANEELNLKPFNLNAIATAGFDFFVQEKIQIAFAACYNRSFSTIYATSSPEVFQLSPKVDQINSLMGGCSKVTFESVGIKISLRYYLK